MRWFIAGAAAVALAWIVFMATPYWAIWHLGAALEAGDAREVAERVNFRALRVTLAKQLAAEGAGARGGAARGGDTQMATNALAATAGELLDTVVTPEKLADLLSTLRPARDGSTPGRVRFRPSIRSLRDIVGLVAASRWRGFRTMYVAWPDAESSDLQTRAQLRFSRLRWRLVSVDLPPEARRLLAEEAARRYGLPPLPN